MKFTSKPNYVVAYLSLHDGELKQERVWANSRLSAMCKVLDIEESDYPTEDAIYSYMANCDGWVNVIEI